MKLTEFLKTVPSDEYIYLGASSGYLWIGKPDEIIEKLPALDEDYTNRIKVSITKNADKIRCLGTEIERAKVMLAHSKDAPELEKTIAGLEREFKKALKRKDKLADRLANRTPFREREVRDVYRRQIVEPMGTVVLVKGREFGDYWMFDEILSGEGVRESTE